MAQPGTPTAEVFPLTYTVMPGDNLWSIADSQLGDGADWPAIAALNLGRTMSDGRRFVDPNLILPGWVLIMPVEDASAAPLTDAPTSGAAVPPTTVRSAVVTNARRKDPSPVSRRAAPRHHDLTPGSHDPHSAVTGSNWSDLPELAALGMGAVGCAALARRSRRLRLLRHMGDQEPQPPPTHSDLAVDAHTLLSRFEGVPALRTFELANCQLREALGRHHPESAPSFRAVCVGAKGVDFWLFDAGSPAPPGFTLSDGGNTWHIGHQRIGSTETHWPYLRIAVPVGEDGAGTWLVPLRPGSCLHLWGEAADDLWRAARTVQEAWSWADSVLITHDPHLVQSEARFLSTQMMPTSDHQQMLFFGDPQLLSTEQRQRIAVVTTANSGVSDIAVMVDRHAATIHPLGRTVRPHLIGPATSRAFDELMSSTSTSPGDPLTPRPERIVHDTGADLLRPRDPRTVEVRLLTMSPRLEGLETPLPPNRARRATELVAYLALHRPDIVTSDRLRTRVLGSSDADAASKTLFNIASAARRAMGADVSGTPLFPPGNRSGHYRVSESVTTDVERAADLAASGIAAQDPDTAIALLRASLELVEGEPLANALSGYTWWESEGHGARVLAVAVNAACRLAALAVNAELFDLADWGLRQARLVDPYSESLSRAAMQVAAAQGDAEGLRREWRECQRRIDELDPGGTPSSRTERLYGELAQRVLIRSSSAHDA